MARDRSSSKAPPGFGLAPILVLVVAAVLEVIVNRVMIGSVMDPGLVAAAVLQPEVDPPFWYTAVSYLGLFLFYFTGALAAVLVVARAFVQLTADGPLHVRVTVANIALIVGAVLAAIPLVANVPALSLPLELAFAACTVTVVAAAFGRRRDLGAQIGICVVAIPLALHTVAALGARFVWSDSISFDGPIADVTHLGVIGLCAAALVSPYCFAPRPFARAVTRPIPAIIAVATAAAGAVVARLWYPSFVKGAGLAIGVELTSTQADRWLAIYLLAIATLVWTLASCAAASTAARRAIGAGISLVVLGGYSFEWPNHYLLPLLGLALIGEATRVVRDDELEAHPFRSETPAIADGAWASYVALVKTGLGRVLADVQTLSARGDHDIVTTVIVGDADGLPVRARIERIGGAVLGLDLVIGKEIDEVRAATLTAWTLPNAEHGGAHPAAPPAAPMFRTNDAPFDDKFRLRGSAIAFGKLFDDALRTRAASALDGWLAYWDRDGLRYRVFPGRGAPLDHPMPLADLAVGKVATPERLVAVVELLVEIARRGVTPTSTAPPEELT
nr:hypothetical protein [Kofleriaceae bacterium]